MNPDWMSDDPLVRAYAKTPEMVERDLQAAHDRERARVLHEKAVEREAAARALEEAADTYGPAQISGFFYEPGRLHASVAACPCCRDTRREKLR